jgi:hypothetical protein
VDPSLLDPTSKAKWLKYLKNDSVIAFFASNHFIFTAWHNGRLLNGGWKNTSL